MYRKIIVCIVLLLGINLIINAQQSKNDKAFWIINGTEFPVSKDTSISEAQLQEGLKVALYMADAGKVEFQWYRYGGSIRQSVVNKVIAPQSTKSKQIIAEFVLPKSVVEENGSGLWELQIFSFSTNEYLKIDNKDVFRIHFN